MKKKSNAVIWLQGSAVTGATAWAGLAGLGIIGKDILLIVLGLVCTVYILVATKKVNTFIESKNEDN